MVGQISRVFLSLSLIEYLLYIFTDQGILIAYFIRDNSGREQLFEQHLFNFFIINSTIRFQSFCEEPGELGTLCYLMLFLIGIILDIKFIITVFGFLV